MHRVTQGKQIQITDRTFESNDSKVYAGYAVAMLRENPQDGVPVDHNIDIASPQRKKGRMEVSYSNIARQAMEPTRRRTHAEANIAQPDDAQAQPGDWEAADDSWEQMIQSGFQKLFGDQPPLRAEEVEIRMQEVVNKQAAESERRMDRKFANLTSELQHSMEQESEKSKRLIKKMFEQQNQLFLNITDQMQENMLKLDENIKAMAMQTHVTLSHTEAPKLDLRKTSPAARRRENESDGVSGAVT